MILPIAVIVLGLLLALFVFCFYLRGKHIDHLNKVIVEYQEKNNGLENKACRLRDRVDDLEADVKYWERRHEEQVHRGPPSEEELRETYRSLGLQ